MKKLLLAVLLVSQVSFAITANRVWRVAPGATLPSWGPVNLADSINAVTGQLSRSNLPDVGLQVSASSGTYSTVSTSFADVTNLSVSITTTGRPIKLGLISDGSTGSGSGNSASCYLALSATVGTSYEGIIGIFRSSSEIGSYLVRGSGPSGDIAEGVPCSAVQMIDTPAAGTYTYKISARIGGGSVAFFVNKAKLYAYEF